MRYDGWTKFNGEFGHIFYKDPFSYYIIAAEYRFDGVSRWLAARRGPSGTTA